METGGDAGRTVPFGLASFILRLGRVGLRPLGRHRFVCLGVGLMPRPTFAEVTLRSGE